MPDVEQRRDRTLVADERLVEAERLEKALHRLHHPAGHDDHVQARMMRPPQRLDRPRAQLAVFPDERMVEVRRDHANGTRKVGRELDQPFALPPVAFVT